MCDTSDTDEDCDGWADDADDTTATAPTRVTDGGGAAGALVLGMMALAARRRARGAVA